MGTRTLVRTCISKRPSTDDSERYFGTRRIVPPSAQFGVACGGNVSARRPGGGEHEQPQRDVQPNLQPNRRKTGRCVGQPTDARPDFKLGGGKEGVPGAGRDKDWTVFKTVARPAFLVEGGFDSHAPPPLQIWCENSPDAASPGAIVFMPLWCRTRHDDLISKSAQQF
jgi:hypothetical protein